MAEKKPIEPISDLLTKIILQSPFYMFMGKKTALIEFTSRQSGRFACQPIHYLQRDKIIQALCEKGKDWWKNIKGGAPVKLVLNGKKYQGWAEVIEEKDKIVKEWEIFVRSLTGRSFMEKESVDGEIENKNLSIMNQIDKSILLTIQLS